MKNYVQRGDVLTLVAPGAVKSGDVVIVGSILGIAATDAKTGENVECQVTGVFALPKTTPLAIDQGNVVYWDVGETKVNKTEAGNTLLGVCTETAGSNDATVRVRIGNVDPAALAAALATLAGRVTALENA